MKSILRGTLLLVCASCLMLIPSRCFAAQADPEKLLWPAEVPGEKGDIGEERDMTKPTEGLVAGKRVIRLGNISKPTISIYRPLSEKDTGAAVLVCPGGGYSILALALDGTAVGGWLMSLGV